MSYVGTGASVDGACLNGASQQEGRATVCCWESGRPVSSVAQPSCTARLHCLNPVEHGTAWTRTGTGVYSDCIGSDSKCENPAFFVTKIRTTLCNQVIIHRPKER